MMPPPKRSRTREKTSSTWRFVRFFTTRARTSRVMLATRRVFAGVTSGALARPLSTTPTLPGILRATRASSQRARPGPRSSRDRRRSVSMSSALPGPAGARVAVVGGGVAGLTAASRLAQAGCDVTVYETGRGPGGRASTRRGDTPDLQWDHGAQFFRADDPTFRALVEEWRAAGFVAEWTGTFGTLDATTGGFLPETSDAPPRPRWVGTPSMSSIPRRLSETPGIRFLPSRRVVGFEGGPGSDAPDGSWTVVHRSSAPPADDASAPPPTRDEGFAVVVAADKQTASDRSTRVYGEPPPLASASAPNAWKGMRAAGQTPSFALMLTVDAPDGVPPLFPFQGATVTGDARVAWVAEDSSKPGRPGAGGSRACWVAQSTPEYAAERVAAKLTVPGTSPHRRLLEEVAEEMTESIVAMAERASGGKVSREDVSAKLVAATAHRWGAAFPDGGATELAAASGGGCLWDAERRVVGCGDLCVKPKVEGAALSGAAAAARTLSALGPAPAAAL